MWFLQGNNLPRVKISNQSAILRTIYYYGPIFRTEIAERLDLTLPTITTNVNSMLAAGLLKELESNDAALNANGRRAHPLGINASACYFAGIEFKGYQWSICVTDFKGRILSARDGKLGSADYETVMAQAAEEFMGCLRESGKGLDDICGVGIGLPGLVNREDGILKINPRYQWKNRDVAVDFARLTGYGGKVTVENNATARGLSAQVFHWNELREGQSFGYLFVSTGIACPLFLNTSSYRGSVVGAGEVGHMVLEPRGRACTCGNHGCLEAYASENAIIRDCVKEMERGKAVILRDLCADQKAPKISEILRAQEEGDQAVCRIIEEAIYMLALATANIVNFTGPDIMLVDCKLFVIEYNKRVFLDKTHSNLCSPIHSAVKIAFVKPDKDVGALGPVAVAIDEKLQVCDV